MKEEKEEEEKIDAVVEVCRKASEAKSKLKSRGSDEAGKTGGHLAF
jgi:hypothetical protein